MCVCVCVSTEYERGQLDSSWRVRFRRSALSSSEDEEDPREPHHKRKKIRTSFGSEGSCQQCASFTREMTEIKELLLGISNKVDRNERALKEIQDSKCVSVSLNCKLLLVALIVTPIPGLHIF